MKPETILITGATGFLGNRLTETLVQQHSARAIVTTGRNPERGKHLRELGTRFIPGDLSDPAFVATFGSEMTAIAHCAALSAPWGTYQTFYEQNVLTTQHLLDLGIRNRVERFVYVSSPSVYATLANRLNVREDDPLPNPFLNAYAQTKHEAEQLVISQLTQHGIPYVIIRPRALIGAGDTVIMPRLLEAQARNRLFVVGNGQNVCDLTCVGNVADAIVLALTATGPALNQTYNITNGEPVQFYDQIEQVCGRLGRPFVRRTLPYPLARVVATVLENVAPLLGKEPTLTRYTLSLLAYSMTLDITRARTLLGYSPRQTTAEGIDEFVSAWLKNPKPQ
jgi:2-alkyl-3-oxoalkanoate reductase